MFSPETIASVNQSWRVAAQDYEGFTLRFFDALEQDAPHLARCFKGDDDARRFQFCAMMSIVVSALEVVDSVEDAIRQLGERHSRFDLRPADFSLFASVLMRTFERELAEAWSEQDAQAWREALGRISATMLEANAGPITAA